MANMSGDNSTSYLRKSVGGGARSSQILKGSGKEGLWLSPVKDGDRTVGTKRFDVTNRSLNRGRGM